MDPVWKQEVDHIDNRLAEVFGFWEFYNVNNLENSSQNITSMGRGQYRHSNNNIVKGCTLDVLSSPTPYKSSHFNSIWFWCFQP